MLPILIGMAFGALVGLIVFISDDFVLQVALVSSLFIGMAFGALIGLFGAISGELVLQFVTLCIWALVGFVAGASISHIRMNRKLRHVEHRPAP